MVVAPEVGGRAHRRCAARGPVAGRSKASARWAAEILVVARPLGGMVCEYRGGAALGRSDPGHGLTAVSFVRSVVGTEIAGQLLITAGDNPDRLASEAAFAKLCGVAPQPATSGKI